MDAKRLVEFGDERRWQLTYTCADPVDGHRADLLGLSFGVSGQSGLACWQQNLERVDAREPSATPKPGGSARLILSCWRILCHLAHTLSLSNWAGLVGLFEAGRGVVGIDAD
jgi:hypothetical protein